MGICTSKKAEISPQNRASASVQENGPANGRVTNRPSMDKVEEADDFDADRDYFRSGTEFYTPTPERMQVESTLLEKSVHHRVNRPKKTLRPDSKGRGSSTDSGIFDAWKQKRGTPRQTFADNNNISSDQVSANESEYGREGIDLASTVEPSQNIQPLKNYSAPNGNPQFADTEKHRLGSVREQNKLKICNE